MKSVLEWVQGRCARALIGLVGAMSVCMVHSARAQPSTEELLEHIARLEKRLEQLEKANAAAPRPVAPDLTDGAPPLQSPDYIYQSVPAVTASASSGGSTVDSATPPSQPPPPDGAAVYQNPIGSSEMAALAEPADQDALRDLMVIRNEAVTVPKGGLDLGAQIHYVRTDNFLQFSRAAMAAANIRYGVWQGAEVSASIPYYYAYRSSQLAPGLFEETEITDFGDASAQITATLSREGMNKPAVFGYIGATLPTGPMPYTLRAGDAKANPVNPLFFYQSSGHYAGTAGVSFVKTAEPVVFFLGLNYTHYWARQVTGSEYQPADRYSYNFGVGLSVSERTVIGARVDGAYQDNFEMDGQPITGWDAESVAMTFSLTQRLSPGFFLEPSVTLGMTSDMPAASVGFGVRRSY